MNTQKTIANQALPKSMPSLLPTSSGINNNNQLNLGNDGIEALLAPKPNPDLWANSAKYGEANHDALNLWGKVDVPY
eukprot:NODE_4841_length_445_cov_44.068182_g4184_i0.p2 GENE.NODE_4841_length_445_cov_44.068182_g4184_i0~~NODE_4841_length_445_cov_44.068182_g4184_i0.p2  ORF type:complete len:77 (-),score=18.28 NODE_4841_length_445_cov_44.068182_g4184_i0:30-260(-)